MKTTKVVGMTIGCMDGIISYYNKMATRKFKKRDERLLPKMA